MTDTIVIIMATPEDESLRQKLADEYGSAPTRYSGSVPMPCQGCDMMLLVGPRSQAALTELPMAHLLCPWCANTHRADTLAGGGEAVVKHLNNPEGKKE